MPVKLSGEYSNTQSVSGILRGAFQHAARAVDGDVLDARAIQSEDDAALQRGGGVVEVNDGAANAFDRFKRALDERIARLHQHLDGNVGRDQVALDQVAAEVKIGLRSGGKADLDFLESHLDQFEEHASLARRIHGLDQGLIAVAQVDAAPDGRLLDGSRRPLTVGQSEWAQMADISSKGRLACTFPRDRLKRMFPV